MSFWRKSKRYEVTGAQHNPAYIHDDDTDTVYKYNDRYNQKEFPDSHHKSFSAISHEKDDKKPSKKAQLLLARPRFRIAAFLAVVLVIGGTVVIGITIAIVKDDVRTYPDVLVVGGSSTKGEITLSNTTWNPTFENSSSKQYKLLESQFIAEMDKAYQRSDLADVYNYTTVEQFRQGSVIVVFVVHLNGATPSAKQIQVQDDTEQLQAEVEMATASDILSVLNSETGDSPLGELPVGEASVTEVVSLTIEVQDGNSENQPPEIEPPSVICPADITQNTDDESSTAIVSWEEPLAEDNSGVIDRVESQPESGSEFMIGETEVTVLAYDAAGNIGVCTFTVTVVDVELPSVICPSNITENVTKSNATRLVTWLPPEATDNSGEELYVYTTPVSGHAFPIGVTPVEVTVRDLSRNSVTCTFFVNILDNERPVVTCPADIAVDTDPGQSTGSVAWSSPNATDNSGQSVSLSSDLQPGNYEIGQHVVTYTGEDESGNTVQCSFDVKVTDNERPVVTCPADIAVDTDLDQSTGSVTWSSPNATDNSGQGVLLSSDLQPGNYNIGQHVVTYTAEDESGNTAQCSFNVAVTDNERPVVTCPADIAVDTDPGQSTGSVTWSSPNAADNSGQGVLLSSDLQPGNYNIGQHVVTYTAEDESGNAAQCSFNVAVTDNERPVVTCPADIAVDTDPGQSTGSVTWSSPNATDNSGQGVSLSSDLQPGSYDIGQHVVTYTVKDESGNTAQCSFNVAVTDNEPPVISCPSDIYIKTQMGELSGYIAWTIPPPTDNSEDLVTYETDYQPGEFPIGSYSVNATATDAYGNTAWCTFMFIIEPLCHPEFCLNEGNCSFSPLDSAYVCECPEGILGKNCEFEVPDPDVCGTNPLFPSTRIVGGEIAYPGSWPWQVLLDYRSYLCGATLITNQWILTAAHCVGDPGARANLNAIILGEVHLTNESVTRVNRSVEWIIVHPGYHSIVLDNDIALIQLTEPVEFDDFVSPACLPSDSNIIEEEKYSKCYATGWGKTDEYGYISMTLLQGQVPLINRTICDQKLKELGPHGITDNMICAGIDERSTCNGDSGGPLVCQEADGRWTLVGITSWGYQCGDPESPSVFVRVSKYLEYIESVIQGDPILSCEPVDSGCQMNVPYTETFTTSQNQIEYYVDYLYRYYFQDLDHSVCDIDEFNATICGFFFKGCDQAIVPCRQYCESIHLPCLQYDYFCTVLPYGPPGEQWCIEGRDYCGDQDIKLSEDSRVTLKNPFLGNNNLVNRDCIWLITGPVGYNIVVRVQFLSIGIYTHTLSVGHGRDPERRSSTIVKFYDQTQLVLVEDHEGWIRLETNNEMSYSGFSALLMVADREHGTFPCMEYSLVCSNLCLPMDWLCDGIRDCQAGEDEANCTITDYPVDVFLTEDEPNYFFSSPGYPQYPPNINATWQFTCPEGFVIRITFLMVETEPCCDVIVVSDDSGQTLLRWSGYMQNEKLSVTSRGNMLLVSYQRYDFAEFSGFVGDVELLNYTSDDVFDCDERFDCGQGVCIPFSGVCNDVINCLQGVDEKCSEPIFVNSSYIFHSPNFPSKYPNNIEYTWYFYTYPGLQLFVSFSNIATEPDYDYIYVSEGSNISAVSDFLLTWSGIGSSDELNILSSGNIIQVTFESDWRIPYKGFLATVEVTNMTRKELNCGTEFDCENGVCLPQGKVCDGRRECGNNADETNENCTDTCGPSDISCFDGDCIHWSQVCDGRWDCLGGEDEFFCNGTYTCSPSDFTCYDGYCIPGYWRCDGYPECDGGEDEFGCNGTGTCGPSDISCYDGDCIHWSQFCDGRWDCLGGEDEFFCNGTNTCSPSDFICNDGDCIPGNWTCDG
ncbi:Hyalin [Holothuria leucospilota]|uniref:Hyalin n=1 Tax=Holothuria leucospilota TaxID=206669 RepID=A0A9Q0YFL4_HOLLE|nr:Hyalin [Holothuria leucospilota]